MAKQSTSKKGRYLYAIVAADKGEHNYGPVGINKGEVYTIVHDQVAAVVSQIRNAKIRPQRKHVAAHHQVLKQVMKETGGLLPMAFGLIAEDVKDIHNILSTHQADFLKQLQRVSNNVEMGLRVTWTVPNIFEYFLATHDELRELRDRFFQDRQPGPDEMIEIGQQFEHLLNEDRETYTSKVVEMISPYCHEFKQNKVRSEHDVMNLVCLVGRDVQEKFEKSIFDVAKLFNDDFAFDYNGPWAPHNFVDLRLSLS